MEQYPSCIVPQGSVFPFCMLLLGEYTSTTETELHSAVVKSRKHPSAIGALRKVLNATSCGIALLLQCITASANDAVQFQVIVTDGGKMGEYQSPSNFPIILSPVKRCHELVKSENEIVVGYFHLLFFLPLFLSGNRQQQHIVKQDRCSFFAPFLGMVYS